MICDAGSRQLNGAYRYVDGASFVDGTMRFVEGSSQLSPSSVEPPLSDFVRAACEFNHRSTDAESATTIERNIRSKIRSGETAAHSR